MTTEKGDTKDHSLRDQRIKSMEGPANTAKELAKKLSCFTYYELLFLDEDATTEEIHRAYIKRTTEIRSRFRSGTFSHEWRLTEFIRALHEAHTVLTSPELRKEYDSRLASGNWEGGFSELLAQTPSLRNQASWSAAQTREFTLKDLLIDAGYASELEIESILEMHPSVHDGPELAQLLADGGLITFEELATALLGKALIDRRQITLEQFKQAAGAMRNHSYKFVDALVDQGWLTAAELSLIGID